MTHLLIDNLDKSKSIGWTKNIDKINYNLSKMQPILENVNNRKTVEKKGFLTISVWDKWLVVYNHNLIEESRHLMYFIEHTTDINLIINYEIGVDTIMSNLKQIQEKYKSVYNSDTNATFLSFAETFESVIEPNFFVCMDDTSVIKKAKQLGVFPMVEDNNDGKLKVCYVDEVIFVDNQIVKNVFAIINFGKTGEKHTQEDGYVYLKIYDFIRNHDKTIELGKAIEGLGANFDKAYFVERFSISDLN